MNDDAETRPVMFLMGTLEIGGSESKFVSLANRLVKAGKVVHVGYLRAPFTLLDRLKGVSSVHLKQTGKWSPRAFRALRRYVHTHGISKIVTVNPYPLTYAAVGRLKTRSGPTKVVASINTSEILSNRDRHFMVLYARLLNRCDHVVFGSSSQQRDWNARYNLDADNTSVIYNGVDAEYFSCSAVGRSRESIRDAIGLPRGAPVIVCVGQLRPEKAHTRLIAALKEHNESGADPAHLLIVGDGVERERIRQTVEELACDQVVHLVGATDDVRPYLLASDVFVLTSIAVETFSNAALEAASMGLPIVMSDVGGSPEMFPALDDCIIYPRNDMSALVSAIGAQLRRAMNEKHAGSSLREAVIRGYSTERMDSNWSKVLWG